MSNIKKVLSLVLVLVMVLGVSATRVQAATGEGTATINGGTNVSFKISSSNNPIL